MQRLEILFACSRCGFDHCFDGKNVDRLERIAREDLQCPFDLSDFAVGATRAVTWYSPIWSVDLTCAVTSGELDSTLVTLKAPGVCVSFERSVTFRSADGSFAVTSPKFTSVGTTL